MKTSIAQREAAKRWKQENKDKVSKHNKKYYETHKDYYKTYYKEYNAKNKDEQKKRWLNWYANNTKKRSAYNKEYSKTHPEGNHKRHRARYARVNGVVGNHFTDAQFEELCNVYENKCLCCGRTDVELTADHVVPITLGVPYSDQIENIQPLCLSCNSKKGVRAIDYRDGT